MTGVPDDVEILMRERVRGAVRGTGQSVALAWSPTYGGYATIDAETMELIDDPIPDYGDAVRRYGETLYYVKRGVMAADRDFMMGV